MDIQKSELLYIDPLAPASEHTTAEDFSHNWLEWALLHNQSSPHAVVPPFLSPLTTAHAVQRDARNCGIFVMCVLVILLTATTYHVVEYLLKETHRSIEDDIVLFIYKC